MPAWELFGRRVRASCVLVGRGLRTTIRASSGSVRSAGCPDHRSHPWVCPIHGTGLRAGDSLVAYKVRGLFFSHPTAGIANALSSKEEERGVKAGTLVRRRPSESIGGVGEERKRPAGKDTQE
jgi:hypothetical protein